MTSSALGTERKIAYKTISPSTDPRLFSSTQMTDAKSTDLNKRVYSSKKEISSLLPVESTPVPGKNGKSLSTVPLTTTSSTQVSTTICPSVQRKVTNKKLQFLKQLEQVKPDTTSTFTGVVRKLEMSQLISMLTNSPHYKLSVQDTHAATKMTLVSNKLDMSNDHQQLIQSGIFNNNST